MRTAWALQGSVFKMKQNLLSNLPTAFILLAVLQFFLPACSPSASTQGTNPSANTSVIRVPPNRLIRVSEGDVFDYGLVEPQKFRVVKVSEQDIVIRRISSLQRVRIPENGFWRGLRVTNIDIRKKEATIDYLVLFQDP